MRPGNGLAIPLKFCFGRTFDGPRLSECEGDETVELPRSEPLASAFEPEKGQDGPAALVEITRRLLHVATSILVLLSIYTFYVSSPVLIPLTLAVLITMLLAPVMSLLDGLKLPRPLSAALVMAMMVGIVGGGAYGLSGPAQEWLRELSQGGGKIDKMLRSIKQPFAQFQQATEEFSSARQKGAPQRVQMATPSLTERLAGGTAQIAAAASVIFVLVFFLLSAGDTFLRKLVSVIPTFKDKKRTVEIIRSVESDISFYSLDDAAHQYRAGGWRRDHNGFLGHSRPLIVGCAHCDLKFCSLCGGDGHRDNAFCHIDGHLRYAWQSDCRARLLCYFVEHRSPHSACHRPPAAFAKPSGGLYRYHFSRLDLGYTRRAARCPASCEFQSYLRTH
jgi:hypothetical protein